MLHLIQSNKMEVLLASLLKKLAEQTFETQQDASNLAELLAPDTILVQSPGMSQWLKINIANTLGIAANIEFPLPSSFIWQLYQQRIPELPKESPFNKQFLVWKILHLLPECLTLPEFESIKRYIGQSSTDLAEHLKTWQLCAKIADVYDQYLMYRPEWILAWEQGEDSLPDVDVSSQPWQPILWRAIRDYTLEKGEAQWHRANMHQALMTSLEQSSNDSHKPLYVFGISAMPVQQLEMLQAIAQQREVLIFWFNPSEHYWADVVDKKHYQKQQLSLFDEPDTETQTKRQQAAALLDVGNPLLASWGKPGRDFLSLLTELEPIQEDLFAAPEPDNLLGWVQGEIFQLTLRGKRQPLTVAELMSNRGDFPKQTISVDDHSIEIHATHSRLRELEVLRDQICYWFESQQVQSLGDIIVMMPDVAVYAPLIEAVFSRPLKSSQGDQERGIPFAISDRSQAQEDTLAASFLRLMSLEHSRMTLTEVFELFKVPEIAARYGIEQDDIIKLHDWCYQAGIRWGWSGIEKQQWQLPEESQNTWYFGLRRLLAGYAHPGDASISDDILPFEEVEGQLTSDLGLLLAFVEDLRALMLLCRQAAPLADKIQQSLDVLDSFYQVDADNEYRLQKLKETVAKLKPHSKHYQGQVSQQVFVQVLNDALADSGVGQRFLAGRLNFCTLMPMRSIPFQHVCILGLNEPDYPRQTTSISFDLVSRSKARKGDRSRRLDDRYLFLEALLSARSKFYLSYQGRDDKNNDTREPSILVSELLDYCQQSVCFDGVGESDIDAAEAAIKAHLLTEHPLQPWDRVYFNADTPASFDQTMFQVATALTADAETVSFLNDEQAEQQQVATPLEDITELDLAQLQQFFRNPVRSWFKSVWKAQFPALAERISDDEPLHLDNLQRYQVTQQLLLGESQASVLHQLELQGLMPIGNLKQVEQDELLFRSEQIQNRMNDTLGTSEPQIKAQWVTVDVDFAGAIVPVTGAIHCTAKGDMVHFRPGKLNANDQLSTWLAWCLFCAVRQREGCAWFFALDKTLRFDALTPDTALQSLQALLDIFIQGQSRCLPFFPKTAQVWADTQDEVKTENCFVGNNFMPGEVSEAHIARVYPDLSACWQEFTELAEKVFGPILAQGEIS